MLRGLPPDPKIEMAESTPPVQRIIDRSLIYKPYGRAPEQSDVYSKICYGPWASAQNKGTFFKARQLAEKIGYPVKGTQVELRKAITELIEIELTPIVGNVSGFTWATNANMVRFYLESLESRRYGLQRRIDSVRKVFNNMSEDSELYE